MKPNHYDFSKINRKNISFKFLTYLFPYSWNFSQQINLSSMLKEKQITTLKPFATLAGVGFAMTLSNPFDLIRIRMQTMAQLIQMGTLHRSYEGIVDCMKRIMNQEGPKAFWKGNSAKLMRFYGSETVNFFSKQSIKSSLTSFSSSPVNNSFGKNFLSGVLGSWISLAILYPIEHARNHQSINFSKTRQTIFQSIKQTVSNQGFRSLYTGSLISLFGVAVFRGTYFGVYDTYKGQKVGFQRWSVAYLSSLLAIMLTYPSDTIRRRLICHKRKQKYTGFSDCSFKVYQNQGFKSFYRGFPIIFFQSLTSSIILFSYDTVFTDAKKYQI